MIVFTQGSKFESSRICLLFGTGLIGSAVARHLLIQRYQSVFEEQSSWHDQEQRRSQYERLVAITEAHCDNRQAQIHVAWCAGTGGFNSSEAALANERAAFLDILRLLERFSESHKTVFHFVSSAGGLFEGSRLIKRTTNATPSRAYGLMKMEQEDAIQQLQVRVGLGLVIYRPSTVFGSHEFHRRSGLVSHLLWNALRNVPTTLEGNGQSLRDYVWADDVGSFIAHNIEHCDADENRIHFMVSAKPTSIFEVVRRVERLMGRSLGCRFRQQGNNMADITFHHSLIPQYWIPTSFDAALQSVLRETRKSFLLESPA